VPKNHPRVEAYGTVERCVVALAGREQVNPYAIAYLNRLGDLLFILARTADADAGDRQRLWRPGATTLTRAAERIFAQPGRPAPAAAGAGERLRTAGRRRITR